MKPNLVAAAALLAATLASAAWAQAPADTSLRPSQTASPMAHLAVGTAKSIDAAGRNVMIDQQAIPSLGMPAMTMQFRLSPSFRLVLKPGLLIAFTFTASVDGLTIGAAQPIQAAGNAAPERTSTEPSMPNVDRPGMGGMAGMAGTTESCQDMTGGRR